MSTATKLPPADTGACGTPKGHGRHRKHDEQPCQPCLDAYNTHRRAQWLNRRARPYPGPLPRTFGRFAGRPVPHYFQALGPAQCVQCFGWRDDWRHL